MFSSLYFDYREEYATLSCWNEAVASRARSSDRSRQGCEEPGHLPVVEPIGASCFWIRQFRRSSLVQTAEYPAGSFYQITVLFFAPPFNLRTSDPHSENLV
jgi:hypothetical protein